MDPHQSRLDMLEGPGRSEARSGQPRPTIQVWFDCAGLYQKVLRSADGTCYLVRCGKCGKTMRFEVGSGGSDQRTFRVRC
jgi:hypothetical protein